MSEPRLVHFDAETGAYVDCRVARGFPLGGMGSGGLCLNTDGSFGELRSNNNWMCPLPAARGSFHALFVRAGDLCETHLLRLPWSSPSRPDEREYEGVHSVRGTSFVGRLPAFRLDYRGTSLRVRLEGLTPHVPHDLRDSTMPAAIFRFALDNPLPVAAEAAVMFSFESPLGRGGTGHLGVELGPEGEMRGVKQRVAYEPEGAALLAATVEVDGRRGVRFATRESWPEGSHRRSVVGSYLVLADAGADLEVTTCDAWDPDARRSAPLDAFSADGRLRGGAPSDARGRAAAVAVRTTLAPGASREIAFALAWWMPEHTTEPALAGPLADRRHDGVRVGHVYEHHFAGVEALASEVLDRRAELGERSTELARILDDSTLPRWLVRALLNSIDSVLCNSVVPASGRLYTLEGVDWHWPMGGLTGTNDQRLSAHPYTATFFPDLDVTELDEFRRLHDARGAIPHGNGNCDLGLGTTDVPYGWPMFIRDFLPAKEWTDLTMSLVLQVARHWRARGRRDVLERFWPDLVRGAEYLHSIAPQGVPEGGTTYDVWDFPGVFAYTATLYVATLDAMRDLAAAAEPARCVEYERRRAIAAARVEELWDERGFYRSTRERDTIFTAALAGDWIARAAGLDPVVPAERAASHLRHQHRVLLAAALDAGRSAGYAALPRAEAAFDGTEVPHRFQAGLPRGHVMTYVWQVVSYQACPQIYVGLVDEGLAAVRAIVDRVWSDGNAWSAGLRGDGESIYMTHPVLWAVPAALTGAALDVPRRTLWVGPRTGGGIERLRCPLFFPGAWAMLDHDPARGGMAIEVLRSFGVPVVVERLRERRADGSVVEHAIAPTELRAGARLEIGG